MDTLLYNPDVMPEEELLATFVGREQLLQELLGLLQRQPEGAGVQHAVLIGPRGQGKTTLLLRLAYAVKERGLDSRWHCVKFPEESYGVYDLADLWLETLRHLADESEDARLHGQIEDLKQTYTDKNELADIAYAALKDWCNKSRRRLVLLLENLDMIFQQIDDEQDFARLRDVLMNEGQVVLLGSATTFFKEARAYDQPLYNFFRLIPVQELSFEEVKALLLARARRDEIPDFQERILDDTHLRVLHYFTGGSPRLVLMLYRVLSHAELDEVRRALEKLLDEVTPYYKAKLETLPPQQRKILDTIARHSSRTHEGMSPADLAKAARLPANQVSSQLKRLADLGYVRAAAVRSRASYYSLSEPLYSLWHQMRMDKAAQKKLQWLVDFLQQWYAPHELIAEAENQYKSFERFERERNLAKARNSRDLLHLFSLAAKPLQDSSVLSIASGATVNYLGNLYRDGAEAKAFEAKAQDQLAAVEQRLNTNPDDGEAWAAKGNLLSLKDQQTAADCYRRACEINPGCARYWCSLGSALIKLGRPEQALESVERGLQIDSQDAIAWTIRGLALFHLERYPEAVQSSERALAIDSHYPDAHGIKGSTLLILGRYEEALDSWKRCLERDEENAAVWNGCAAACIGLMRYAEALEYAERALQLDAAFAGGWAIQGHCLVFLQHYPEAVASYDRALALKPDDKELWNKRAQASWAWLLQSLQDERLENVRAAFAELIKSGQGAGWEYNELLEGLKEITWHGHPQLARELIREQGLDEALLPMARALDYLASGDRAPVERLAPEIREVVETIIRELDSAKTTTPA